MLLRGPRRSLAEGLRYEGQLMDEQSKTIDHWINTS